MPDASFNAVVGFLKGLMRRQFYFIALCFLLMAVMVILAGDWSTSSIVLLIILGFALILFTMLAWFWTAVFSNFGKGNKNVGGQKQ